MRPRSQLLLAVGAFLVLIVFAVAAGRDDRGSLTTDVRRSSLSPGPHGTRALAEVLERTGMKVTRWSRRLTLLDSADLERSVVVVVDPPGSLSQGDADVLFSISASRASVLLAGNSASNMMRCLGYGFDYTFVDSASVRAPSGARVPAVVAQFEADSVREDSSMPLGRRSRCPEVPIASIDTVLRSDSGAVFVRIHREDSPYRLLLLSDAGLLGTTGLRLPELPAVLVGAIRAEGDRVIFDEFHHAGDRVSMAAAALAWSRSSPWGWMLWQLVAIGFLWFVFGGVRFGPVLHTIRRQRRSPLEHVRALATVLAASNGHDVAIGAIVRGLRRRLAAASGDHGRRLRNGADTRAWMDTFADRITNPEAREPAQTLVRLTRPGQSEQAVRTAANAVEDVWDALH